MTAIVECEQMCKHTPFGRDILSIKDVADWKEAAMRVADMRAPNTWNSIVLPSENKTIVDETYKEAPKANWEKYTGLSFKDPSIKPDFGTTPDVMSIKDIATSKVPASGTSYPRPVVSAAAGGKKPKKTSPKKPKTAKK